MRISELLEPRRGTGHVNELQVFGVPVGPAFLEPVRRISKVNGLHCLHLRLNDLINAVRDDIGLVHVPGATRAAPLVVRLGRRRFTFVANLCISNCDLWTFTLPLVPMRIPLRGPVIPSHRD